MPTLQSPADQTRPGTVVTPVLFWESPSASESPLAQECVPHLGQLGSSNWPTRGHKGLRWEQLGRASGLSACGTSGDFAVTESLFYFSFCGDPTSFLPLRFLSPPQALPRSYWGRQRKLAANLCLSSLEGCFPGNQIKINIYPRLWCERREESISDLDGRWRHFPLSSCRGHLEGCWVPGS